MGEDVCRLRNRCVTNTADSDSRSYLERWGQLRVVESFQFQCSMASDSRFLFSSKMVRKVVCVEEVPSTWQFEIRTCPIIVSESRLEPIDVACLPLLQFALHPELSSSVSLYFSSSWRKSVRSHPWQATSTVSTSVRLLTIDLTQRIDRLTLPVSTLRLLEFCSLEVCRLYHPALGRISK